MQLSLATAEHVILDTIGRYVTVLGLDVITPESLFGYETEGVSHDTSPGASGHEEEKVVLPDTSNILQPGIEVTRNCCY